MAQDPGRGHVARRRDRHRESIRVARPRRRRLSDRAQMELHAERLRGAEVPGLQLRRKRTGHLSRPRSTALQPACAGRGHGHCRLCDGRDGRLQLHSRRIHERTGAAFRSRRQGGLRGGSARQEHRWLRYRFRPLHLRRRGRVHLRRGDGAARIARREAGQAPFQAAVPGQLRPLRQADYDQQHAEPGKRTGDYS